MHTEKFLRNRRGVRLEPAGRMRLEQAIDDVKVIGPRTRVVRAGEPLSHSTLLIEGFMCRYLDDRKGLRQLVAVHVPGDFVDLHGYPLMSLEHDVATISAVKVATIPHKRLQQIEHESPETTRKLWFATLVDSAIHRTWLFRLGRLDGMGRVAHILCELNVRLALAGLSDGQQFDCGLTQSDIAEVCGLTNVHVNRVVRGLREEELCVLRSSRVDILDFKRLAARGQFDPTYLYVDETALGTLAWKTERHDRMPRSSAG